MPALNSSISENCRAFQPPCCAGYSGSVVDAVCSCSDDDLRIHREIGGEVEAVDCAIEVPFQVYGIFTHASPPESKLAGMGGRLIVVTSSALCHR